MEGEGNRALDGQPRRDHGHKGRNAILKEGPGAIKDGAQEGEVLGSGELKKVFRGSDEGFKEGGEPGIGSAFRESLSLSSAGDAALDGENQEQFKPSRPLDCRADVANNGYQKNAPPKDSELQLQRLLLSATMKRRKAFKSKRNVIVNCVNRRGRRGDESTHGLKGSGGVLLPELSGMSSDTSEPPVNGRIKCIHSALLASIVLEKLVLGLVVLVVVEVARSQIGNRVMHSGFGMDLAFPNGCKGGMALGPRDFNSPWTFGPASSIKGLPKVAIVHQAEWDARRVLLDDSLGNFSCAVVVGGDVHAKGGTDGHQ